MKSILRSLILLGLLSVAIVSYGVNDGEVVPYSIDIPDSIDASSYVIGWIYNPDSAFGGTPIHKDTLEKVDGKNKWWDSYTIPANAEHGRWLIDVSLVDGGVTYYYSQEFTVNSYGDTLGLLVDRQIVIDGIVDDIKSYTDIEVAQARDSLVALMADLTPTVIGYIHSDIADDSDIDGQLATIDTEVGVIDNYVDTEVESLWAAVQRIDTETSNLPSDPADQSLIMAQVDSLEEWVEDVLTDGDSLLASTTRIEVETGYLHDDIADDSDIDAAILAVDNFVDDLENRLTADRAGKLDSLDNLDETISGRSAIGDTNVSTGTASISAADMASIADSTWGRASGQNRTLTHFDEDDMTIDLDGTTVSANATVSAADRASIADSVWDALQGNHSTENTFGYFLDARVSEIGTWAGSGTENVDFYVKQDSDSTVLANAYIHLYTDSALTSSSKIAKLSTGTNGLAEFALDPDTLYYAVNYQAWRTSDSLMIPDVDTTKIFTVYLDVTPATPSDPNACNVYGVAQSINAGEKVEAIITVTLNSSGVPRLDGGFVADPIYADTADATTGEWSLNLYPNTSITDDDGQNTTYTIKLSGTNVRRQEATFTVPDTTTIEFDDLTFH